MEVIKATIQKILKDKILLGLVIVGLLGIFVGGITMGDDKDDKKAAPAPVAVQNTAAPGATTPPIAPNLAADFVGWWLGSAMDYNAASAAQSHNQAMSWMTEDAARTFGATFWNAQIADAVTTNRLVAAFQPSSVQAQAVNPDGSIVVGVSGNMVVQTTGQPVVQQFAASFLVRQEQDGLRVAGIETRSAGPGGSIF